MSVSWTPDPGLYRRLARWGIVVSAVLAAGWSITPAAAQLMSGDSAYASAPTANFFAMPSFEPAEQQQPRTRVYITTRSHPGGGRHFCVRTCDGRYFPLPQADETASKTCEAVCPGAETRLYSGSDIESARSEQGETYKTLANAFRFQREIVPQCSCRSDAAAGLAAISIEDDMTLRTGDIVAANDGFKIVAVSERQSGARRSILFRPLSSAKVQALGLSRISSR
ncbi:DUF2865 domain-containing protein [Bradyrhizobium tropiciagri]|uniref:DUF2865 domain-containing protein n=1 Tax=Bradyrhizobium tropiciagri TaxID=312253 RepID=UPI001BA54488|nr:DUF2865 domain-containing protein [Bradyrhizobium tropiciagri]MBR0871732.1 DUF2865 domain-containing protein [Bradyrhizobium tropiciagri]